MISWSKFLLNKPEWCAERVHHFILRLRYLKEVKIENISPALAIMFLEK